MFFYNPLSKRGFFSFFSALLLFCAFLLPLRASSEEVTLYFERSAPSWVKPYDFPLENIPLKPSQVNLQYLLIDNQKNVEEKTFFRHYAIKAVTQRGIEAVSKLEIDFDPSCTHVIVHDIRVFRKGEWYKRLDSVQHKLIQREAELEKNLYSGHFTLVYFLDDIREGDIVEFSYSLVGENPLASSYYTDQIYMQRSFSVEKIIYRLLLDPNLYFNIKRVNTEVDPQTRDLNSSLREWVWETSETLPYVQEQNQPIWYNVPACIEISQYSSWKEVSQNVLPLYHLRDNFFSSEMQGFIEEWKASSTNFLEQALFALRFVQDEVRYLGLEEGIRAFKPTDPRTTLQRRFGDCKDKTFLLHAFLKLMGISSRIVLVNTSKGRILPDLLPSPFAFDHVVLQLEIDGNTYFVDPTWSLQGGSLENIFFPDYEWGLILAENTTALCPLPKHGVDKPTEINSSLIVETEDKAYLTIKSTFYGVNADRLRRSLEWYGSEELSENYLSCIQEIYGTASKRNDINISDSREDNIFTLIESYNLPVQLDQNMKKVKIYSCTLRNYFSLFINPQRSSPFEIPYPLWVKERIQVESPYIQWSPEKESFRKSNEAFLYDYSVNIDRNSVFFDFELKHLQDHIPKHALHDSWKIVSDIEEIAPCIITVANNNNTAANLDMDWIYPLALLVTCIFWVSILLMNRKQKKGVDVEFSL